MSPIVKALIGGILVCAGGMAGFVAFRMPGVEEEYVNEMKQGVAAIEAAYRNMQKRSDEVKKPISPEDLSAFLKAALDRYPHAAVIAIADESMSVRHSVKNDRYLPSAGLFERVCADFARDRLMSDASRSYAVRYYDDGTGGRGGKVKLYIFIRRLPAYRLLVAYPHEMHRRLLVRTILEAGVILILSVMASASIYILSSRRTPPHTSAGSSIHLDLAASSAEREDSRPARLTVNVMAETLGGYARDLFGRIAALYSARSVSLYLFHPPSKMVKVMELKGATFLRIESATFDSFEIDNEAGKELRAGAGMVLNGGTRILLPVSYEGRFLGAVEIMTDRGLSGRELAAARSGIESIARSINEFCAAYDLMSDPSSGLHSRLFFNLKAAEAIKSLDAKGRHFSIVFIDCFHDLGEMTDEEKGAILRLVARPTMEITGGDSYLCRWDDYLGLVLNDTDVTRAAAISDRIRHALEECCIRLRDGSTVRIKPRFGFASSDEPSRERDIALMALQRLRESKLI